MLSSILVHVFLALQAAPQTSGTVLGAQQASGIDKELAESLLSAKRIYVESFGEDSTNRTLQAMVIDAIGTSKRFIITENKDRADLFLKGSSLEKTTQEMHALGSATSVAGAGVGRAN